MAKNKSLKKAARKPAKKSGPVTNRGQNGTVTESDDGARLTHERLRKLAKKHRPPDDYFVGEMEKPW